jgi:two-component system, OmpR family, sensor histidine kinase KdpD
MIASKRNQYVVSITAVIFVSGLCFAAAGFLGYKVVALLLLVTVSLLASIFDIFPVLIASTLSALIWNFFFIPPLYTFHIDNAEDILMFLMYFVIALLNSTLTFKIRQAESKVRDKEEKDKTIHLYNTLLNSLSHELRTPISTIIGAVDTIKESGDKLSVSSHSELLSEIEIAVMRLDRQVENLLNMSRLETGMLKPHFNWCDINELVYDVIHKIAPAPCDHQIFFTPNASLPLFKMDSGLIEDVLLNLIQNAIQYTPVHSEIIITTNLADEDCNIEISDNGKGIPEEELKSIFDKFYRLPHSKTGGTGLGLSIAKGFVEAHNGTLTAKKNKAGGATFIIQIPAETSYINNLKNE